MAQWHSKPEFIDLKGATLRPNSESNLVHRPSLPVFDQLPPPNQKRPFILKHGERDFDFDDQKQGGL